MKVRSRFVIAATFGPLALVIADQAFSADGWDGTRWRGCDSASAPQRYDSLQVVGLTADQRLICFKWFAEFTRAAARNQILAEQGMRAPPPWTGGRALRCDAGSDQSGR